MVELSCICGQTDPALSYFALLYQEKILKEQWLLYVGIMCVLLSKVDIQANSCGDLECVDNCDTSGNWNIFFIYLY